MAATRGRRDPFPCGHVGLGKFCHRCATADQMLKKAEMDKEHAVSLKAEAARLKAAPAKKVISLTSAPTLPIA